MFRISKGAAGPIINVNTLDEIEPVIRRAEPGRYHIEELPLKPFPSGHTSRRWGVVIKRADGSIGIEPDPREA
jgi:hypothetical protein